MDVTDATRVISNDISHSLIMTQTKVRKKARKRKKKGKTYNKNGIRAVVVNSIHGMVLESLPVCLKYVTFACC